MIEACGIGLDYAINRVGNHDPIIETMDEIDDASRIRMLCFDTVIVKWSCSERTHADIRLRFVRQAHDHLSIALESIAHFL